MPAPKPQAILWGACERCRGGGEPSPVDNRFCELCLPRPETLADLSWRVERRLRAAKQAADRPVPVDLNAAVAPDAEHLWLTSRAWGTPHLFADAERESRCGKVALLRPVRVDLDPAAPPGVDGCKACWRSYRRGRRGS